VRQNITFLLDGPPGTARGNAQRITAPSSQGPFR
jgi:hypothetical protein